MARQASRYHHGEMDIHAQQATFKTVMSGTKWACLTLAVGILFFTLLFCTEAGFFTAFASAFVVAALGGVLLRQRPLAH